MSARVTGVDRELAEAIYSYGKGHAVKLNEGHSTAAWVARHREQATAELVEALREVLRYRRGEGKYRFAHLPSSERECAAFDAWQEVEARIEATLSRHEPTDAELLDQVCRSADEALKPLGEVGRG